MMSHAAMQEGESHADNVALLPMSESDIEARLPKLRTNMEMDRLKPLPTSLQSDFLPDDVLFALTQPPMAKDKLGPPSRNRNLATTTMLSRQPAANLWSHKRQEKFKHLLDSTLCNCGAGKDISFMYDVPQEYTHPEKPETFDKSAVRKSGTVRPGKILQLPDTLIPEEYHIVRNRGVKGLEYHEDKYTLNPEDHDRHLVVFPSLMPNSRFEVTQLRKTMDDMLEKMGFNDWEIEVKGPTQMHNLFELIKKEQNIYNIIFHELIRQTSVDCTDRGQLLAEVRKRYSQLISKIPHQVIGLHEEVVAQRALDRRLTEELMRFKNTIALLTNELLEVKEHDKHVTEEALKAQKDLREALEEARKNSALLSEYHDLYEMQRLRLEKQVTALTEEKEIWSTVAYSLVLKVTAEYRVSIVKQLLVNEKAWAKYAGHFTILLSDRDTEMMTKIQGYIEKWRHCVETFNTELREREDEMKESLFSIQENVEKWAVDLREKCFNKNGRLVNVPDKRKMEQLQIDFRAWGLVLSKESQDIGGHMLLHKQDQLNRIRKQMENWTDFAITVFNRHKGTTGHPHPDQKTMIELNEDIEKLLLQYQHHILGEKGYAAVVIHLQNVVEAWDSRFVAALHDTMPVAEKDWLALNVSLSEWVVALDHAQQYVGTTQSEQDGREGKAHISIDVRDLVNKVVKWSASANNAIDREDGKLVEQVSVLHADMVRWMAQTLLRIAPNKLGNSVESAEMVLLGSESTPQLHDNAKSLFKTLRTFTKYVMLVGLHALGFTVLKSWWYNNDPMTLLLRIEEQVERRRIMEALKKKECCSDFASDSSEEESQDSFEDGGGHEIRDLKRLQKECNDWIHTAKIVLSQLTGEPTDTLFPEPDDSFAFKPLASSRLYSFTDQEKLQAAEESSGDHEEELASPTPLKPKKREEHPSLSGSAEQSEGEVESAAPSPKPDAAEQRRETEPLLPELFLEAEEKAEEDVIEERLEMLDERSVITADLRNIDLEDLTKTPVTVAGAPDTQKAFEEYNAVSILKTKLLAAEQRAQEAEERASKAESVLATAEEMIRSLQRQKEKLLQAEKELKLPEESSSGVKPEVVASTSSDTKSLSVTKTGSFKTEGKKKEQPKQSGKSKKK